MRRKRYLPRTGRGHEHGLPVGLVRITRSGCLILLLAACTEPAAVVTGDVVVNVQTTGEDPDPDGYQVVLSPGGETRAVGVDGAVRFEGLAAGSYNVTLEGQAYNCAADPAFFTVTVAAGESTPVAVTVTCERKRWSLVETGSSREMRVDLVDASRIRALGRGIDPEYFWSDDGGETWSSAIIEAAGDQGTLFAFVTESLGFFGGAGCTLGHTKDGGATWTVERLCPFAWYILTHQFTDPSTGWVGGGGGRMYRSSDGGEQWSESPVSGYTWPVRGIAFFDADHALFVGSDGNGAAYTSDDGGATWVRRPTNLAVHFEGFAQVDDHTAVAVGSRGVIARTTDRGVTWTTIRSPGPAGPFWSVDFATDGFGVAAGEPGIFVSNDGGATWDREPAPIAEVSRVAVLEGGVAWVGGSRGRLLKRTPD